jgi:hypothetical protein
MATLGTNATTSLTAFTFNQSPNVLTPANMATLKAGIVDDINPLSKSPNSFVDYNGLLMIPRRGMIKIFPGDVIAFDPATGFPIIVSAAAIASGSSQWHFV